MKAVCTIASLDYLPQVEILLDSMILHNEETQFYIVIVDIHLNSTMKYKNANIVSPNFFLDLNLESDLRARYDVVEFATAIKPFLLSYLLEKFEYVLYLDPDVKIFTSLSIVFEELQKRGPLLTPHKLFPGTGILGIRQDMNRMQFGVFNLGFIGVNRSSFPMLEWWSSRTAFASTRIKGDMVYTDQKWIDLVPSYFNFNLLRHPGCNVAFWNLDEREIRYQESKLYSNYELLVFFHFSQFLAFIKDGVVCENTVKQHLEGTSSENYHLTVELLRDYLKEYEQSGELSKVLNERDDLTKIKFSTKKLANKLANRYTWSSTFLGNKILRIVSAESKSRLLLGAIMGIIVDFDRLYSRIAALKKRST